MASILTMKEPRRKQCMEAYLNQLIHRLPEQYTQYRTLHFRLMSATSPKEVDKCVHAKQTFTPSLAVAQKVSKNARILYKTNPTIVRKAKEVQEIVRTYESYVGHTLRPTSTHRPIFDLYKEAMDQLYKPEQVQLSKLLPQPIIDQLYYLDSNNVSCIQFRKGFMHVLNVLSQLRFKDRVEQVYVSFVIKAFERIVVRHPAYTKCWTDHAHQLYILKNKSM